MTATTLTDAQILALAKLCGRYGVPFVMSGFTPRFDLPNGYVAGWAGPIYVGCSPDGEISS